MQYLGIAMLLALTCSGCAALRPAVPTESLARIDDGNSNQLVRGRPYLWVDRIGWVVGIPNKLALWNRRADNHAISTETEQKVLAYVMQSGERTTLIRVNQYDPIGEWGRLGANQRVGIGWRYTIGTLHLLKYSLLPGRIYGGDSYNPYTDTLNLYSDIPALGIAEAAYARDIHGRRFPGSYAAVQDLPLVGMWHKSIATRTALDYYESLEIDDEQREGFAILYANYGGNWGSELAAVLPYGHFFGRLSGAAIGHATNGVRAWTSSRQNTAAPQQDFAEQAVVSGWKDEAAHDEGVMAEQTTP